MNGKNHELDAKKIKRYNAIKKNGCKKYEEIDFLEVVVDSCT